MKRKAAVFAALLIILAAFLISRYAFQLMVVQGDSMLPTYRNMQFVWIDKMHREPERGVAVAFYGRTLKSVLVKRVAAIPGDVITVRAGKLYVNGEESRMYSGTEIEDPGILSGSIRLEEEEYFMLGDNLNHSIDSRSPEVGIVLYEDIIGKIV